MIKKIMMTTKLLLFAPCFLLAQYSQAKMNELALEMRVTTTKALCNAAKITTQSSGELLNCAIKNAGSINKICDSLAHMVPPVNGTKADFIKKSTQYRQKCLKLAPSFNEFKEQNNASSNLERQLNDLIETFHEDQDTTKTILKPEPEKLKQNQEDTSKSTKKAEVDTTQRKNTTPNPVKKTTPISISEKFKEIASETDNVKIQFLKKNKKKINALKPKVIKDYLKSLDQKLFNDYSEETDKIKMLKKVSQYLGIFDSSGVFEGKKYDFMYGQYELLLKDSNINKEVSLWKKTTDENLNKQTRLDRLKEYLDSFPKGVYIDECLLEIIKLENDLKKDNIIRELETNTIKKLVGLYLSNTGDQEIIDSIIWTKIKEQDNFLCYNHYRMKIINGKFQKEATQEMQKKLPWFIVRIMISLFMIAGSIWGVIHLFNQLSKKKTDQDLSSEGSESETESANHQNTIKITVEGKSDEDNSLVEKAVIIPTVVIPDPSPIPPLLPRIESAAYFSPEPHPDGYFDGFRFSDTKEGCLFEMNIPKDGNTATFKLIDSPEVIQILVNNDFANIRQACEIVGYHRNEDGSYKTRFKGKEGRLMMEARRRWRIEKKCEISFDGVK